MTSGPRSLVQDLRGESELIETHISWVFRRDDDVIKVKKPVNLGFLDFSDREKRHLACVAEVELNRRLAPSVYLGVVPITLDKGGKHVLGGQGEVVDWAVHMRRLPDADRADIRLEQGRLTEQQLDFIVARVAEFHDGLGPSPPGGADGGLQSIRLNIEENFEQTRRLLPRYLNPDEIKALASWQASFLEGQSEQLEARARAGRVREGHGDLRLEHIYLTDDGTLNILDCIEFNKRFRIADTCADIVFLAMDLTSRGRADLAERTLAVYARESNDFDMFGLVEFYQSYRAFVRGKISAFVADGAWLDEPAQKRAEADARRYFLLALACEMPSVLPPMVVAVGGIIASGKSSVANRIAAVMSAPVIDADRTRKYLAGIDVQTPVNAAAFEGMYSPDFTEKTYREVIRRGAQVIRSGRSVVLDASFRTRAFRELARNMASECNVAFLFVECRVDERTCLERLEARSRARGVSDGRTEIFDDFVKHWEATTELQPDQHLTIDTSLPLDDNIETLALAIPTWPAGLTGP